MTDRPEPANDPGHLLPDADWERVKAHAEQLDAEYDRGAQEDDPHPDEDES